MAETNYNPIETVGGSAIACPSKYEWTINDVSASDAGRTEDGKMHKKRIARKRKLELEWKNKDISVIILLILILFRFMKFEEEI